MTTVVERTLEDRLAYAQTELECARMIDNWQRSQQEVARWSKVVADLKRQIADRDERLHVQGAVAAMEDAHAG